MSKRYRGLPYIDVIAHHGCVISDATDVVFQLSNLLWETFELPPKLRDVTVW